MRQLNCIVLDVASNGFDGVLYPVKDRIDKIVIVMSGSEGGLEHARKMASYLQEKNIPAIALGFFKTQGTGRFLSKIPVEYIGCVISWLHKQGYRKIAIEGVSKGAEYALACATTYPDITCVILKTPSWFYSEGFVRKAPSGSSCWSRDGKELPYTPYTMRRFPMLSMLVKAREFNILPVNTGKVIIKESVIPVEKVNGPILIFSTRSDTVWPSAESGEKLESRLKKYNFTYPYRHVCFDHMSHMMLENASKSVRHFFKSEKKFPKECKSEREQMGMISVNWLEKIWK